MNKKKAANYIQDLGALIALVLLIVVIGAISPEFRTVGNFLSLLRQSSINGLIAFGMTCVILTGGIDLSVGSVLALTTALCAGFISGGMPVGLAMILALVIGTGFGCISGFLVTKWQITALYCNVDHNDRVPGTDHDLYGWKTDFQSGGQLYTKVIGKGNFYHIPIPVILFLLIFVIFLFVLQKTTFGRHIYATGSNAKAANLAGVNIDRTKLAAYAISGCMAALSGLILLSRLGSAQPTLGEGYELDAIAAVALGGTSMNGGRGKIWGTFIGVLIIAVLNNGLNILGVSSYYQDVVKGIVILIAVLSDRRR